MGGVSLGLACASVLRAEDKPPRKLGLALCGLGRYAVNELAASLLETKNVRLVGAVTGTPAKGLALSKQHGFSEKSIYSYEEMGKLADNPEIDVVYVVTPPGIHAQNTIAAFAAGKHVICEKPMANTVAECDAMIAAAKKANRQLAIGYRLHFDPYTQELIRMAQAGEMGPIKSLHGENGFKLKSKVWRIDKKIGGGGPLMDMGIYPVHEACLAMQANPVAVVAKEHPKTRPEFFTEVEEGLDIQLEFPSGLKAEIWTSYNEGKAHFRVEGERGWFEGGPIFTYRGLKASTSTKGALSFPPLRQQQRHMDAVAAALAAGQPVPTPGTLGRRDMVIIEGIYKSAGLGGKRVELTYA
jgi:glucose-fructose oxidoreductase